MSADARLFTGTAAEREIVVLAIRDFARLFDSVTLGPRTDKQAEKWRRECERHRALADRIEAEATPPRPDP